MSGRPKSQESQSGDLRNRSVLTSSARSQQERTIAEISMKDFLDFLKISYQVNEAIDNSLTEVTEKTSIDWKKLTSDALITRLKEREAVLGKTKVTKETALESKENSEELVNGKSRGDDNFSGSEGSRNASRQNSEEKLLERRSSTLSLDRKPVSDKLKRPLGRKKSNHNSRKDGSIESETSRSLDGVGEEKTPAKLIKKKLNEVLQEGIFDSVLPYLIPKQQQSQENLPAVRKFHSSNEVKKVPSGENNEKTSSGPLLKEKTELRRKSFSKNDTVFKNDKKDIEVVIHVCDEIKNLKRDFKCSQKLLVSQMGYFAEVTTGQKLEDMDISVHCDVTIFDWLMRWVQKGSLREEHWPILDSSIVIPVLMSSAFLQMNSLQEHCLVYCKNHINEIIRDSPNLGCINDNVLTRLANLFSNSDIENITDKKDKIQSKLFCKLIYALTEPESQPHRGHFSSLATLYRCSKCLKLILRNMSGLVHCVSGNMFMDRNGTVHSSHVYDSSWNLTDYVRDLKNELKTWRRVYWRLWGDCHLLYCLACEEYFPVHHMSWCRFHIESVQYFPLENQRSVTYPVGKYSCCGERAYRFEVIKKNSGCQYRDHIANPKSPTDTEIMRIWNIHKEVIKSEPPPLLPPDKSKFPKTVREENFPKKLTGKDVFWWEGLELVPSKQPSGFLTKIWDSVIKKDESKSAGHNPERSQKSLTKMTTASQINVQDFSSFSDSSDESSSSSPNSEESYHSPLNVASKSKSSTPSNQCLGSGRWYYIKKEKKKRKRKKKKNLSVKNEGNRFWLSKLSTRCNQDNQREFEERALRQIESILAKKFSGEGFRSTGTRSNYQVVPAGGIYVKLEQEWREAHCFSHGCPGSSIKARGSASFVNVNNSSFSVQKRSKSRGHRS